MSYCGFGFSRQEACPPAGDSSSRRAGCRHIYRRLPPHRAECTTHTPETIRGEYSYDHGRTPVLRHRRTPEEYEISDPGKTERPEGEDSPEDEETSVPEDGEIQLMIKTRSSAAYLCIALKEQTSAN
jgi:hypothetical protein